MNTRNIKGSWMYEKLKSARRKPISARHLRLRHKLIEIVEISRLIDIQIDRILRNMKRAEQIVQRTIRKIK